MDDVKKARVIELVNKWMNEAGDYDERTYAELEKILADARTQVIDERQVSDEHLEHFILGNCEFKRHIFVSICTELLARRKATDTILKAVSKIEEFEFQNKDKIFSSGKAEYGNLIQWTSFTLDKVHSELIDFIFVIKSELNTIENNKGVL